MPAKTKERAKLIEALNDLTRELSTYTILLHQAIADRLRLNITDHKCLDLIERKGSMTAGQLADITGLTTGAITGVIDRLEKAGYVRRERDPEDRRKVIVSLVPEKAYKDISPLFEKLSRNYEPINEDYTTKELYVIFEFMQKSNQALKDTIVELRRGNGPVSRNRVKSLE